MLNHITIMGRLVRDPELRRTPSGVAVASFCLAVDRDFADKQSGEKETDFIDVTAWRGTAEFVNKYFIKGQMAIVSGRLQIRNYTDKDGNKRRNAEVVADNVYFGESKRSADGSSHTQASQNPYAETEAMIARYTAPAAQQSDFTMLEDDDPVLPF